MLPTDCLQVFDDNGNAKVAVSDVSFACGAGECFGLLGKARMLPVHPAVPPPLPLPTKKK